MAGTRMIFTTRALSGTRAVRWLLCASVVGVCLSLVLLGFYNQRSEVPILSARTEASFSLQGFQTTFHAGGRPQLHVSGDSFRVSNTRLIGPFRLGFAHTIKGRDIAIEIFDVAEFEEARQADASVFSPQHILSRLVPQQKLGVISRIDLRPVSLRLNRDNRPFLTLSADRAQVKLGSLKVKLRGHVTLRSHTGERLSAEEMNWNQRHKVLEVKGAYVLTRPHAEQRGSNASFIVDRNGDLKRYPSNTRSALGPEKQL